MNQTTISSISQTTTRAISMDTSLLASIKKGDQYAFEQLYYRYHKPVYGFLVKATRSAADSEDIVQEVFARLWNMRDKIEPERNIKALIFLIARRAAVDLYRRTGRVNSIFADREDEDTLSRSVDLSPEEILEQYETKMLLNIAIESMPKKQREVFSLYFHENLSPAEIAQKLGMSYENVRKQIWNGKKQLREVVSLIVVFLLC